MAYARGGGGGGGGAGLGHCRRECQLERQSTLHEGASEHIGDRDLPKNRQFWDRETVTPVVVSVGLIRTRAGRLARASYLGPRPALPRAQAREGEGRTERTDRENGERKDGIASWSEAAAPTRNARARPTVPRGPWLSELPADVVVSKRPALANARARSQGKTDAPELAPPGRIGGRSSSGSSGGGDDGIDYRRERGAASGEREGPTASLS